MHKYFWLLCLMAASATAYAQKEIVFGIFPYVSPSELVRYHAPLRQYLSRTLDRPVTLVTAPDFKALIERTQRGEYDIVLTAPHLGRLAQIRDGYQPVARTRHEVQGLFLARKDAGIAKPEDIKGKRIMMAEPLSIVFHMAEGLLNEHGVFLDKNATLIETKAHNNAMYAPLRDEADVGVTGFRLWEGMPPEEKDKLVVVAATRKVPGFFVLAHQRMPAAEVERLRRALLAFEHSPEGPADYAVKSLKGFSKIDAKDLAELDPYVKFLLERP
ncbi:MAG: phosphate/phosphite/phosphonate ABC transporter substrate-binding protein [Burkholderiales bacterium]|nr:phosphate/phosphite/phosphonate ABC transporter substrate-binding protein [Burkholderiales bacterium]